MSSSRNFAVTEPHPTVPRSGAYIGGGRGGAGNYRKYKAEEVTAGPNATGPASRVPLTRPFKRLVAAGRGGAGNMVANTEESIFQFDEELVKKRETEAPVYRIGRGGAGNLLYNNNSSRASKSTTSSRKDSTDSSASETERPAASTLEAMRRNSALSMFSRRSS